MELSTRVYFLERCIYKLVAEIASESWKYTEVRKNVHGVL